MAKLSAAYRGWQMIASPSAAFRLRPMLPNRPITLQPITRGCIHTWRVPGSKSLTNRAFILAALAEGESRLSGVLHSDDTRHMRNGLTALGIHTEDLDATTVLVRGGRSHLGPADAPLFIGNSGTSVRFLSALAALVDGATTLHGDEHMAKRPIKDLVDALRQQGIEVACRSGCPPLTVHGGRLPGGTVMIPGSRSSQYFSALMMAGTCAETPLTLAIDGELVSRPYVEMTAACLRSFGVACRVGEADIQIGAQVPVATAYAIEPDASAASYPLAIAAATGSRITVPGLDRNALQGDVGFADMLARLGVRIATDEGALVADARNLDAGDDGHTGDADTAVATASLTGVDVDMHHISDTVMTLAALAPLCDGPTMIRNIANIRIKETDRLEAMATELRRLGQVVRTGPDYLHIDPRPVQPATVECYADHRIAMSFAVLGLAVPGITIADPACVAKTYPGFWDDLAGLYRSQGQAQPW